MAAATARTRLVDLASRASRQALSPERSTAVKQRLYPVIAPLLGRDLTALGKLYGTDKAWQHGYTPHYERHLPWPRRAAISILEIGVGGSGGPLTGGASLRMWASYYPRARVVGIDINEKVVDFPRVEIRRGDQSDPAFLHEVAKDLGGSIDLVVDDGSHVSAHVRASFEVLFPYVSPGGRYVIEDLQTSYWDDYGGAPPGSGAPTTAELAKSLLDGLNHESYRLDGYQPTYTDRHVAAIHAYPNIVFLEKGAQLTALPVYLVHYDAPEWCASAAAAILQSEGVEVALTIVDNGRRPGSPATDLAGLLPAGVRLIRAESNVGFSGAANLALDDWRAGPAAADHDVCVIGSHDLHPEPDALGRLVEAARRHRSYGVLAAAVVAPTVAGGGYWDGWRPRRAPPDRDTTEEVVERDWVPATCVLLRRECVDATGGFDARFGSYVEDVDLCLSAAKAGFGVGYVPQARVRGLGSASPDVTYLVDRNTMLVAAKHGGVSQFARAVAGVTGAALQTAAAAWLAPHRSAAQRAASRSFVRLHVRALGSVVRSAALVRTLLRASARTRRSSRSVAGRR